MMCLLNWTRLHLTLIETAIVALAAGITATLTVMKFFGDLYKSPKIQLSQTITQTFEGSIAKYVFDVHVIVTNIGRRPITITSVELICDLKTDSCGLKESWGTIPVIGSKSGGLEACVRLEENQIHRFIFDSITYEKMVKMPHKIEICISDSRGNSYPSFLDNVSFELPT